MTSEPLHQRRPILHPSRWPIWLGGLLVVGGSFLPWQTATWLDFPPEVRTGVNGYDAPGVELMLLSAATLVVAALRAVASSRTRWVQWLPGILGLATAGIAGGEFRNLGGTWGSGPSSVVTDGGFWTTCLGAGLVALGGVASSLVIARNVPLWPALRGQPGLPVLVLPPLLALLGGIFMGVASAVALAPALGSGGGILAPLVILIVTVVSAVAINSALNAIWPLPEAARRRRTAASQSDLPDLEPVRRQGRRP